MKLINTICFLFLLAVSITAQNSQTNSNENPEKAKLVVSDIDNFWRAYDLAQKESSREKKVEIYQREYFDKGSEGLKDFTKLRIESAKDLVANIELLPKYYASIRETTLQISKMRPQILNNLKRLKKIYPKAAFPDVYFLIGRTTSGGTFSKTGLLIGAEMFALTPKTSREDFGKSGELGEWLKAVLKPARYIPSIVSHELIHYQQNFAGDKSLLEKTLNEGSADFVGQLISEQNPNDHIYKYGNLRETELWNEFKAEMMTEKYDKWLYNGGNIKDRPSDLGYFIGYKICEAYYKKAKDKKQAIADMLNIKDAKDFLEKSGYGISKN